VRRNISNGAAVGDIQSLTSNLRRDRPNNILISTDPVTFLFVRTVLLNGNSNGGAVVFFDLKFDHFLHIFVICPFNCPKDVWLIKSRMKLMDLLEAGRRKSSKPHHPIR